MRGAQTGTIFEETAKPGASAFAFRHVPDLSESECDDEIDDDEEPDLATLHDEELRKIIKELLDIVTDPDVLLGLVHDYASSHNTQEMQVLAQNVRFVTVLVAKDSPGSCK
jgi:hypothetical protein